MQVAACTIACLLREWGRTSEVFYHRLGCLAVYRDTGIKWSRKIQVHVHALLFVVHYTSDVLIRDKERLRYLIICLSYSDAEKSTILKWFWNLFKRYRYCSDNFQFWIYWADLDTIRLNLRINGCKFHPWKLSFTFTSYEQMSTILRPFI